MQKKDAVTNEYLNDPEHFADLVNGYVFEGEQVIDSADVREKASVITRMDSPEPVQKKKAQAKRVIIDVIQTVCKGMMVTVIHLENQSDIHVCYHHCGVLGEEALGRPETIERNVEFCHFMWYNKIN